MVFERGVVVDPLVVWLRPGMIARVARRREPRSTDLDGPAAHTWPWSPDWVPRQLAERQLRPLPRDME